MEEIYANVEFDKSVSSRPSTNKKERRFHGAAVLCLGLLSVILLCGLIGLSVHYHNSVHGAAAEIATIKINLTERLQASNNKLSSLNNMRELLKANLTEMNKEMDLMKANLTEMRRRVYSPVRQRATCAEGWKIFNYSCYFLSTETGSWTKGREDCKTKGADLVAINSRAEQAFLSEFTKLEPWIGLNDRDQEGTWNWADGTPLTVTYWAASQPDNGGGDSRWGEEDCVHTTRGGWNDRSCKTRKVWICEKGHPLT